MRFHFSLMDTGLCAESNWTELFVKAALIFMFFSPGDVKLL